jgi:aminoglycoside phosphotransferase (APT) family kinase protein
MHATDGAGLPDQHDGFRAAFDRAGSALPPEARTVAEATLDALPRGTSVCHGDFHPGNVVMSERGPVVIDWLTASRGNPVADVARTLLLATDAALPRYMGKVQVAMIQAARRRFGNVYLRRYQELRPIRVEELASWRLPLLAARLGEDIADEVPFLQAELARLVDGDQAA